MAAEPARLSVVGSASSAGSENSGDISDGVEGLDGDFVAIYKTQYPRLVRALELGGTNRTAAEDIAQEAFARTLSHWQRVRNGSNPAGYVYRVAFRLTRRRRGRELASIEDAVSEDFANESNLSLEIERAIQSMPAAQRRCAVLCLIAGIPTRDAARALGIAESTVRKQIERARGDLRLALRERSPEGE
jgi:RNA polymerase sigma-70 factor, ECF subfamily